MKQIEIGFRIEKIFCKLIAVAVKATGVRGLHAAFR